MSARHASRSQANVGHRILMFEDVVFRMANISLGDATTDYSILGGRSLILDGGTKEFASRVRWQCGARIRSRGDAGGRCDWL